MHMSNAMFDSLDAFLAKACATVVILLLCLGAVIVVFPVVPKNAALIQLEYIEAAWELQVIDSYMRLPAMREYDGQNVLGNSMR